MSVVRTPTRPAAINTRIPTAIGSGNGQRKRSAAALSAAQKLSTGVISQAEYRHILEMDQRLAELDNSPRPSPREALSFSTPGDTTPQRQRHARSERARRAMEKVQRGTITREEYERILAVDEHVAKLDHGIAQEGNKGGDSEVNGAGISSGGGHDGRALKRSVSVPASVAGAVSALLWSRSQAQAPKGPARLGQNSTTESDVELDEGSHRVGEERLDDYGVAAGNEVRAAYTVVAGAGVVVSGGSDACHDVTAHPCLPSPSPSDAIARAPLSTPTPPLDCQTDAALSGASDHDNREQQLLDQIAGERAALATVRWKADREVSSLRLELRDSRQQLRQQVAAADELRADNSLLRAEQHALLHTLTDFHELQCAHSLLQRRYTELAQKYEQMRIEHEMLLRRGDTGAATTRIDHTGGNGDGHGGDLHLHRARGLTSAPSHPRPPPIAPASSSQALESAGRITGVRQLRPTLQLAPVPVNKQALARGKLRSDDHATQSSSTSLPAMMRRLLKGGTGSGTSAADTHTSCHESVDCPRDLNTTPSPLLTRSRLGSGSTATASIRTSASGDSNYSIGTPVSTVKSPQGVSASSSWSMQRATPSQKVASMPSCLEPLDARDGFGHINRDDLAGHEHISVNHAAVEEKLREIPLLQCFDVYERTIVAMSMSLRALEPGAVVCSEGHCCNALHLLLEGELKAFRGDPQDANIGVSSANFSTPGRKPQQRLSCATPPPYSSAPCSLQCFQAVPLPALEVKRMDVPGMYFGEEALLSLPRPSPVTVRVVQPSTCLVLEKIVLERLLRRFERDAGDADTDDRKRNELCQSYKGYEVARREITASIRAAVAQARDKQQYVAILHRHAADVCGLRLPTTLSERRGAACSGRGHRRPFKLVDYQQAKTDLIRERAIAVNGETFELGSKHRYDRFVLALTCAVRCVLRKSDARFAALSPSRESQDHDCQRLPESAQLAMACGDVMSKDEEEVVTVSCDGDQSDDCNDESPSENGKSASDAAPSRGYTQTSSRDSEGSLGSFVGRSFASDDADESVFNQQNSAFYNARNISIVGERDQLLGFPGKLSASDRDGTDDISDGKCEQVRMCNAVDRIVVEILLAASRTMHGGDSYAQIESLFGNPSLVVISADPGTAECPLQMEINTRLEGSVPKVTVISTNRYRVTHFADACSPEQWAKIETTVVEDMSLHMLRHATANTDPNSIAERRMRVTCAVAPKQLQEHFAQKL